MSAHLRQPFETLMSVFVPTADPRWILVEEGFHPAREHEIESLFTVANGYVGTRGAVDEANPLSRPATFVAGLFDASSRLPELVVAPDWAKLEIEVEGELLRLERGRILEHRRVLDMRRGVLLREWRHRDSAGRITRLTSLRFASLADKRLLVHMIALTPQNYTGRIRVECVLDGRVTNFGGVRHLTPLTASGSLLVARTLDSGITLAMAAGSRLDADHPPQAEHGIANGEAWIAENWEWEAHLGATYLLDRMVAVATSRETEKPSEEVSTYVDRHATGRSGDLLMPHQHVWERRWNGADVEMRGDAETQRALRFAIYHLVSSANPDDERVSVGARDLTGEAYKGHVFWDTEIYMLPFYIFTHPPMARALLMYRYHTLPAAREWARELGYRGALYPWESAATGEDATPPFVLTPAGEVIPILSRLQEHHISADIAYAVWQYWRGTGDDVFFLQAGAEILLETARFWASRAALEKDGYYHIRNIIGPDEYHEGVDDSAFTNVMAQWVLEKAIESAGILSERWPQRWRDLSAHLTLEADEVEAWRAVSGKLAIGYDPSTGLFEQFAGYSDLEYVDLSAYEPRSAPMDVILGREKTQGTQVIKQADVVLLIYLLWERFTPEAREANFRYYEPRTGHGSSLSPSIYSLVAARLGDMDMARRYFQQAAEIDLANNMGNAAEGIHIGAMGGLWQAAVFGFAGVSLREDGLSFDPHVPVEWGVLRFPFQWRGRSLRVAVGGTPLSVEVVLENGPPLFVSVGEEPAHLVEPGRRTRARLIGDQWSPWEESSP